MAVMVEMQNTGDPGLQREVAATIEHALADRPGDWRVSIIGSQANDRWEMKIIGPNAFERSYTLEGSSGEHRPEMIRVLRGKLVDRKSTRLNSSHANISYAVFCLKKKKKIKIIKQMIKQEKY